MKFKFRDIIEYNDILYCAKVIDEESNMDIDDFIESKFVTNKASKYDVNLKTKHFCDTGRDKYYL